MRPLTQQEHRTIRWGGIGVGAYLTLYLVVHALGWVAEERQAAGELELAVQRAETARLRSRTAELRALKLRKETGIEFSTLKRETLVGEAAAKLKQSAEELSLRLGPFRELAGREGSSRSGEGRGRQRELALLELDVSGPASALVTILWRLPRLGCPLVLEGATLRGVPQTPGDARLEATVAVLDPGPGPRDAGRGAATATPGAGGSSDGR